MKLRISIVFVVLLAAIPLSAAQGGDGVDQADAKAALLEAYPGLFTISGNTVTWSDGATMVWDDGKARTAEELIKSPDIEDMFHYIYPTAIAGDLIPDVDFDPGRIRNEAFFKKLYGASAAAVGHHLTTVKWLPKLGKYPVRITSLFGVDARLSKISNALQDLPVDMSRYGLKPGGGFNWRVIAGTDQLSVHSFGAAFDINVGYSDYWFWNKPDSKGRIPFKNRIPLSIVTLFEKQGFIWGGRWYHYDTMHFEYRPELLLYKEKQG
ncbi:M15 family metallopeptidase [Mesorhizobium sophorae]|uniref:M15 family metallopeptidase n=1 Tax=Mesorhizobium sophorae TaxID=1300294 RepID=UPI000BA36300|nr:M15 family metallopeptidase [Mesorhizobium sophorae]